MVLDDNGAFVLNALGRVSNVAPCFRSNIVDLVGDGTSHLPQTECRAFPALHLGSFFPSRWFEKKKTTFFVSGIGALRAAAQIESRHREVHCAAPATPRHICVRRRVIHRVEHAGLPATCGFRKSKEVPSRGLRCGGF